MGLGIIYVDAQVVWGRPSTSLGGPSVACCTSLPDASYLCMMLSARQLANPDTVSTQALCTLTTNLLIASPQDHRVMLFVDMAEPLNSQCG